MLLHSKHPCTEKYHFEEAVPSDAQSIAKLHEEVRVERDYATLPAYTQAAVREGYFQSYWARRLGSDRQPREEGTSKIMTANRMVGFVRFGAIDDPFAQTMRAPRAVWSELHQIYIKSEHQKLGLGALAFHHAAAQLTQWGCERMLINVLEGNHNARGFYEHEGARHVVSIIEHNTRNNIVFEVPCALYVYDLS